MNSSTTSVIGVHTLGGIPRMASPDAHGLTARELQVLQLAAAGHAGAQIADELSETPSTVQSHLDSICAKLGVTDRASAIEHALRAGLIT